MWAALKLWILRAKNNFSHRKCKFQTLKPSKMKRTRNSTHPYVWTLYFVQNSLWYFENSEICENLQFFKKMAWNHPLSLWNGLYNVNRIDVRESGHFGGKLGSYWRYWRYRWFLERENENLVVKCVFCIKLDPRRVGVTQRAHVNVHSSLW